LDYVNEVKGLETPQIFIAAIEQGIREACSGGVLSGFPLTGVKVALTRVWVSPDDSTEMAFKIAASMAFKRACEKAVPVLVEPIMKVEVVAPADYMGAVINDLNARRGRVLGITSRKDVQVIDAEVPLAETFGYATALRSATQGRATYTMQLHAFEKMPTHIQTQILQRIGRA
jgi:elongation factor G